MHNVAALALEEVVAFDLAIPAQVFGHPAEQHRYSFRACAAIPGLVPSTTGFAVHVQHGLETLTSADTVVVVGYTPHQPPAEQVLDALRTAAQRGARMVSVCTGAFALAAAGLLDGRRATTHWLDAGELADRYPKIDVDPTVLYVDEGAVMTSAGVAAGIDLCLHVVRADYGEQAAATIARRMIVAPHREGGQAQYLTRPMPPAAGALTSTCTWAIEHLDQPLTITSLARHAGYAPRTFARRFIAETGTTPLRWLTAQRLLLARRLLETTTLPVNHIAARSGLGTAANLRLHLRRDIATSPSAYRHTYQGPGTTAAPPTAACPATSGQERHTPRRTAGTAV